MLPKQKFPERWKKKRIYCPMINSRRLGTQKTNRKAKNILFSERSIFSVFSAKTQSQKSRLFYFFKRVLLPQKFSKKLISTLSLILLLVQPIYPLFNFAQAANNEIKEGKGSNAPLYKNTNPDFKVEFGQKENPNEHLIRFSADPTTQNPFGEKETSKVKRIINWVKDNILPEKEKAITLSLKEVKIDEQTDLQIKENPQTEEEQKLNEEKIELQQTQKDLANLIREKLQKNENEPILAESPQNTNPARLTTKYGRDTVTFPQLVKGIDIDYQILEGKGVKEDIVIQNQCLEDLTGEITSNACTLNLPKNSFTFNLALDEGVQLHRSLGVLNQQNQNPYYFTDDKGNYLFHFLPLVATDAKGEKTNDIELNIQETNEPNKYLLTVKLDLFWLMDPNRAFPVTLDPSIVHDESSEFSPGTMNRTEDAGSGSNPKIQIKNPQGGNDQFTKLLLHADGTDNSTTFKDSSMSQKSITAAGDAKIKTNQSKFGGSSAYFDGSGDYLSSPDNDDFEFKNEDFTIDLWVYPTTISGSRDIISKRPLYSFSPFLIYLEYNRFNFFASSNGTSWDIAYGLNMGNAIANTWTHLAVVRRGSTIYLFNNGNQVATTSTTASLVNNNNNLYLGSSGGAGAYFEGYLDEVRLSKGIARWTSNFTPPTRAYDTAKPYAIYTSPVIDAGQNADWDTLQWTENGVKTGDGETPYSTTNLVAQWNFNETSGTSASDSSGKGHTGTLTNMTTSGQDADPASGWTANNKKWGTGAIMFDGTNDYVTVPHHSDFNVDYNFSAEVWVKTKKPAVRIFRKWVLGQEDKQLSIDSSGRPYFFLYNAFGSNLVANKSVTDNQWHHIAATYDGSAAKIYIDGQLDVSASRSGNVSDATGSLVIGRNPDGGTEHFQGIMDSLRLYSRALSAEEILANYQAGNIEFQTRSGSDSSPDDGNWEDWKPTGSGTEEQILSLDNDSSNWSIDTGSGITLSDDSTLKQEGSGSLKVTQGQPQADANTVGLWHMEETSGSGAYIKDSSSYGYHGTPTGTTPTNGISGKGRYFDGDDYFTVGDHDEFSSTQKTVEAWVKINGTSSTQMIAGKRTEYFLLYNDTTYGCTAGKFGFTLGVSGNFTCVSSSTTPALGQWYHVVGTYDGSNIRLYVNGVLEGGPTAKGNPANDVYTFAVGARVTPGDNGFNGIIDEVKYSNIARSADEIAEAYRLGRDRRLSRTFSATDLSGKSKLPLYIAADRPGQYLEATLGESAYANYESDSNTVGLWHLEEQTGSGAYLKDSSGNGNHGTPYNTTSSQGMFGKNLYFNGSSYITVPDNDNFSSLQKTVEAWVKLNETGYGTDCNIAGKGYEYWLVYSAYGCPSNTFGFVLNAGLPSWPRVCSKTNPSPGQWYHVVGAYNGSSLQIYVNGVLEESMNVSATQQNGTNLFNIGGYSHGNTNYFKGFIDEVKYSNIGRSASDIRAAYEIGKRTHPVTIDFGAKLDSANLISNSSDTSFTVDETIYTEDTNKAPNLYAGDKIIVKENVNGTEYLAQGTVTSVSASTGATTVAGWDVGSTFPSSGYSENATVFKWQREYIDLTGTLSSQLDAVNRITLRAIDNSAGRTIYLDDLKSAINYMTDPAGATINSGNNRYLQYRTIFSTTDTNVTPYLSSVTANYEEAEVMDHFTITGNTAQEAGSDNPITITAIDQNGDTATFYTGDHTLNFSGGNDSPNGAKATIKDKNNTEQYFGSDVTLTFTNGIATTNMKLVKAESAEIDATDGTYSTTGNTSWDLNVTVSPADLDIDNSVLSLPRTTGMAGSKEDITVTAQDQYQNPITNATVQAQVSGANSRSISLTHQANGSYQGSYTPANSGLDSITAAVNSQNVIHDTDGTSDGTFHLSLQKATTTGDQGVHDYLASVKYGQNQDVYHEIYFKPENNISGGAGNNKVIIQFPDADDGLWCRVAGTDLIVTTNNLRETGANPLPGTLSAECTQGSGPDSYDKIIIHNVNNLTAGKVYGVKVSNDDDIIAKLGTPGEGSSGTGKIILNNGEEDVEEQEFQYGLSIDPEVNIEGYIAPTLTFDVIDADTNNSIGFGTLSISSVRYATADETGSDSAPGASEPVRIYGATNADDGIVVYIRSEKEGLYSPANGYTISADESFQISAGTEGYGIYAKNQNQFTIDEGFDDDAASDIPVTSSDQRFLYSDAPVENATADLSAKAAISATTPAGNYADILTLTGTGRY